MKDVLHRQVDDLTLALKVKEIYDILCVMLTTTDNVIDRIEKLEARFLQLEETTTLYRK